MSRKSVVMVRWKKRDEWQAWSSLAAFCSANPRYPRQHIYARCKDGIFDHYLFELRRVPFIQNPVKTRKGGVRRVKPGPKGPRTTRTQLGEG